jgi:hypothetical protein
LTVILGLIGDVEGAKPRKTHKLRHGNLVWLRRYEHVNISLNQSISCENSRIRNSSFFLTKYYFDGVIRSIKKKQQILHCK